MATEPWDEATCARYASHVRRVVSRDRRPCAKRLTEHLAGLPADARLAEVVSFLLVGTKTRAQLRT